MKLERNTTWFFPEKKHKLSRFDHLEYQGHLQGGRKRGGEGAFCNPLLPSPLFFSTSPFAVSARQKKCKKTPQHSTNSPKARTSQSNNPRCFFLREIEASALSGTIKTTCLNTHTHTWAKGGGLNYFNPLNFPSKNVFSSFINT